MEGLYLCYVSRNLLNGEEQERMLDSLEKIFENGTLIVADFEGDEHRDAGFLGYDYGDKKVKVSMYEEDYDRGLSVLLTSTNPLDGMASSLYSLFEPTTTINL